MTYFRKNKRESKITAEAEHFCSKGNGPLLLREFYKRIESGKTSMRGRNYDTQPDHNFHSAEQRTYHDRMEDRV